MKIVIRKAALKALRKMDSKLKERFMHCFRRIADGEDQDLDIKPLAGRDGFRLRIGSYRAIFNKDFEVLDILHIGSRGDIYK